MNNAMNDIGGIIEAYIDKQLDLGDKKLSELSDDLEAISHRLEYQVGALRKRIEAMEADQPGHDQQALEIMVRQALSSVIAGMLKG